METLVFESTFARHIALVLIVMILLQSESFEKGGTYRTTVNILIKSLLVLFLQFGFKTIKTSVVINVNLLMAVWNFKEGENNIVLVKDGSPFPKATIGSVFKNTFFISTEANYWKK